MNRPSRPPAYGRVVAFLRSLIVPVALFLVLRTFVVEAFHIWPSGSMERTLLIGDFLFVNKALYGAEVPVLHRRLPALRRRSNFAGSDRLFRVCSGAGAAMSKRFLVDNAESCPAIPSQRFSS